jgi:hypothetical protein
MIPEKTDDSLINQRVPSNGRYGFSDSDNSRRKRGVSASADPFLQPYWACLMPSSVIIAIFTEILNP